MFLDCQNEIFELTCKYRKIASSTISEEQLSTHIEGGVSSSKFFTIPRLSGFAVGW